MSNATTDKLLPVQGNKMRNEAVANKMSNLVSLTQFVIFRVQIEVKESEVQA